MDILKRCRVCFNKDNNEDEFSSIFDYHPVRLMFQYKFGVSYHHFIFAKHLVLICSQCHSKVTNVKTGEELKELRFIIQYYHREHFLKAAQKHFNWPSSGIREFEEELLDIKSNRNKQDISERLNPYEYTDEERAINREKCIARTS